MLVALLLPFASQAQSTLTVADGTTTNNYVPVYGLYVDDFVRCQTVYPASMLAGMQNEAILGLTYYLSTPATASWGVANFVVNIMEVPDTTLSAFVDMTNATTVYTGSLDATQSTMVIEFTTPYMYQGGNLMVEIYNTLEGTYKSASFYGITKTGASWQGNNGTSVANITGATRAFIPKTTFAYGNPPTCFKVTGLAVNASLTTSNSLTLTWNDLLNTNATYSVYAVTATDTTLVQSGITAMTYTVTGLAANTDYAFAVMTDCGGGDVTDITAPVSGHTACEAISTLPYTMGFEADEIPATTPSAQAFPYCWTRINDATGTSNYYPYSYSSYPRTGSRSLYFYSSTTTSYATNQLAVLPQLNATLPVSNVQLSFWVRGGSSYGSNLEVGTMSDPTDNTTFTTVQTIAVPVGSTYENHVVYFVNAPATDSYIAFRLVRGTATQYAYVDDVVLDEAPSCFMVSNANVDTVDGTSATLSWTDSYNTGATYSIYNMADTSLVASGIAAVPGANAISYTVTGLTGNTSYTFGIVANCSATDASDYSVVSLHTACVTIATLPYTMGFEADEIPATTPNAQAFPYCWTRINDATSSSYTYYPYSYSSYPRTGSRDLYFSSSTGSSYATNQLAVLPQIDATLPVNTLQLSFWVRGGSSYGSNLEVGTMSDPTDNTTFTTVQTIAVPAGSTYENHVVYFMNAPATDSYIAFRLVKGTGTQYAYVDDVVLDEAPSCFPVTNLTAFNITDSSVTLSWVDNMNNGATYTLMNGTTVVANNIPANADSIAVVGLSEGTIYTLSVVANCSADDASEPVSVTVQTMVSPTNAPYATGFESGEDCLWMTYNDNTNAWHIGSAVNNGGSNALYISNDNGVSNAYTVSGIQFSYATRPIMLSDSTYYVYGFDWKANGESSYDYLRAWLVPGQYIPTPGLTPGGTTSANGYINTTPDGWIDLNPAGGKMNLNTEWQNVADTILLESGLYTVVLMWANDVSGGTQPPVAVDNFSIAPYVPVPLIITNLHGDAIAHNAFTAVWNGNDRQTMWACGLQGPADTVINWFMTYSKSKPFFELTPNTTYNVYVKAYEPFLGYYGDSVMATVTTNDLPMNCAVIAEGTTTDNNAPVYGYYADAAQKVQSIYPASMLTSMVGQTFTSMHYFVSSGSSANWGSGTWYVRMGVTTQENLADGFDTTALTTYYTGNLSASTTDGMTITFDQPFTYNGGNLLVEFEQPTASGWTQCYFYGTSATSASFRGYGSGYGSTSLLNFLPQVQFCAPYTTTCFNIDHLVVENVTTTTAQVYWYPGNVETEWEVAYGTGDVDLTNPTTAIANQLLLSGLTADMDYWFYVRPVCDSVTYGNWTSTTFATLPTCGMINPANILVENLTNNSVTFIVNGELDYGTMHHFTVDYWTDGGDTVTAVSTGNSVVLNNLQSNTTYYVTFTANCDANGTDNSRIAGPYTFNTACDAIAIPFVEDFEAESTTLNCWSMSGNGSWSIGTGDYSIATGAYSGTYNARITHSSTGNVTKLISPVLDGGDNGIQLQFAHVQRSWAGDIDELRVYTRASDSTDWQLQATYTDAYATWTVETLNISNPVYQVAFEMTDSYGYGVGVDSVVFNLPPSCMPVANLAVDSVTATSVTISWTDNTNTDATYTIYNDSTVVATGITGNTYTVNGLTASTGYTFGVVANCSATSAADMVTVNATTDCANGSCSITVYAQDSYGDGWSNSTLTFEQNGATVATYSMPSQDLYSTVIYDTFQLNVCGDAPLTLSWTSASSWDNEASFTIVNANGAILNSVSDASTLTGLFATLNNPCSNDTTGGDTTVVVPDTISITFAVNDATMGTTNPAPGTYQYEEGTVFSVTAVPNAGYHLADWTITMNIPGYGPMSYNLGTTEATIGDTASLDFDGIIITALFASDSTSDTTATCDPITVFPYTQDFSAAPACWSVIDADGDGYNWELIAGAVHSASYDNNVGALTPDNWLVTPQFQLAAGTNYEVTWNANPQDTSWPAEHYGIFVSTTTADTAAFTLLQEWTLTAAGNVPVVNLNSYAGQTIYLAFRHWNCTDMFRIAIDNFQLREAAGANQVTVTLTQNNPMYGSVNGGGVYTIGDSVTVTATPAANYMFVNWADANGATVSTANPYTFVAATDITLQAIFQADNSQADSIVVTYTVNDTTMGSITPSGDHYVHVGDAIQAAATPNAGYMLDAWVLTTYLSGTAVGADTITTDSLGFANPMNFGTLPQVYADYGATITVTAIFAVDTNTSADDITIVLAVNDATMGTTNPAPGTYTFAVGDSASVTAIANNGYHFVNWVVSMGGAVVDSSLTAATYSIDALPAMLAGMTLNVMANFAADSTPQPATWTVSLSSADETMGTVSPAGDTEVADGASFTATATPNAGYQFSAWMSGNTVVSIEATYTFTVTTNIALVAVFLPDSVVPETRYHVTGEVNDATMGYVSGSGYYVDGTVATLTAHAYEGYRFVRWSTGETTETINITVDGEDVTVTAYFEAVTGIEDADMDDVTVYSTDSKIVVRGAEGSVVYVFDVNGRLVNSTNNAAETVEFRMANTGVYLVKVGAAPAKRVLVVR